MDDISEDAMKVLVDHDWPGNVRELENAIERAMATCDKGRLCRECFDFIGKGAGKHWEVPTDMALAELEKEVIPAVLERTGGNIKEAAGILGIDRSTLYDKIRRYAIPRRKPSAES
jgi:DNA-binding NtrC family response regulator